MQSSNLANDGTPTPQPSRQLQPGNGLGMHGRLEAQISTLSF